MLTKSEFGVLSALAQLSTKPTQRAIAAYSGLALGTVNATFAQLKADDLVNGTELTPAGAEALEPYRVKGAIILAAGESNFFRPMGFDVPKSLLRSGGELLIERKIEQLQEAGVENITLVVGYKKEYLFYLGAKYGVRLLENPSYRGTNTITSLWCARDFLDATYVCMSDDYFGVNPFRRYVYRSYLGTVHREGKAAAWCVETGRGGRIIRTEFGAYDADVAPGFAYLDHAFCERYLPYLEQTMGVAGSWNRYWEEPWLKHLGEFNVGTLRMDELGYVKFNRPADLERYGADLLDNVHPAAVGRVCGVLGCEREHVGSCELLSGDEANVAVRFKVRGESYVYRQPRAVAGAVVSCAGAAAVAEAMAAAGVDGTYVHADATEGWSVARAAVSAREVSLDSPADLKRVAALVARVHEGSVADAARASFFERACDCEQLLGAVATPEIPGYAELRAKVERLNARFEADMWPRVLSHNAMSTKCLLARGSTALELTSWDWSGVADEASDCASLCIAEGFDDRAIERAVKTFIGHEPSKAERRHYLAACVLCAWCGYVWELLREANGEDAGAALYEHWAFVVGHIDEVLAEYEG